MAEVGLCDGGGECSRFKDADSSYCQGCGRRRAASDPVGELRAVCVAALADGVMELHEWKRIERFRETVGRERWRSVLADVGLVAHRVEVRVGGALTASAGARAEVTFVTAVRPLGRSRPVAMSQAWLEIPAVGDVVPLLLRETGVDGEWRCSWMRECAQAGEFEVVLKIRVSSPWGDGCYEEWTSEPVRVVVRAVSAASSIVVHDNSTMLVDGRDGVSRGGVAKTVQIGGASSSQMDPQVDARVIDAHVCRVAVRPQLKKGIYLLTIEGFGELRLAVAEGLLLGSPRNRQPAHDAQFLTHVMMPLLGRRADGTVDEHLTSSISRNAIRLDLSADKGHCRVTVLQAAREGSNLGPRIDGERVSTGTVRDLGPGGRAVIQVGLPASLPGGSVAPGLDPLKVNAGVAEVLVQGVLAPEVPLDEVDGGSSWDGLGAGLGAVVVISNWELRDRASRTCWMVSGVELAKLVPRIEACSIHLWRGRLFVRAGHLESAHVSEIPVDGTPVSAGRYKLVCRPMAATSGLDGEGGVF